MQAFKQGEIDLLVSTTVIEVGVNVPNATVMIIMDADRFGLSQLHQLRGRVGRGDKQSYAVLVANPKTESGKRRMKIMTETTNGFCLGRRRPQATRLWGNLWNASIRYTRISSGQPH